MLANEFSHLPETACARVSAARKAGHALTAVALLLAWSGIKGGGAVRAEPADYRGFAADTGDSTSNPIRGPQGCVRPYGVEGAGRYGSKPACLIAVGRCTPDQAQGGSCRFSGGWDAPNPQQRATAQKRVHGYLVAVHHGRRPAATRRWIAVETLRPTKEQRERFLQKWTAARGRGATPLARQEEATRLRALMVFDTQTQQFVGPGCYIIDRLPVDGELMTFDAVEAEFVGQPAM
jgi:hypothetical protein